MLIVLKPCVYLILDGIKLSFCVLLKLFALVEGTKYILCISVAYAAGIPRLFNFGLLLRKEFARFTCLLGSKSATIYPRTLITPTFSMHEKS